MTTLLLMALMSTGVPTDAASTPTATIRYVAPPDCPSARAFFALLEERTAGTWRLRAGDGEGSLVVEIRERKAERKAERKIGSVRRTGRSDEGVREIAGTDCRDLVEALALSAALSLKEEATAKLAAPAGEGPGRPVAVALPPSWWVGGGLLTTFLFPSEPMPQVSLFVERGRAPGQTPWKLGPPDLRLSASYARNDLFGSQRARFALADAALALCPTSLGGEAVALRLCLAGEVGVISGEGVAIMKPATTRFLWAAAGVVLHLRWSLSRRLVVEAQAGVSAPLERTTFIFEMPRVEVTKVPAWVATGGIMAGFTIP